LRRLAGGLRSSIDLAMAVMTRMKKAAAEKKAKRGNARAGRKADGAARS